MQHCATLVSPYSAATALAMTHALAISLDEWRQHMRRWSVPEYRAKQVFGWVQQQGRLAPEAMHNLPEPLRARLSQELQWHEPLHVERVIDGGDGTRKLLLRLGDYAAVESVLIPRQAAPPQTQIHPVPGHRADRRPAQAAQASIAWASAAQASAAPAQASTGNAAPANARQANAVPTKAVEVTQCVSSQVGCAIGCVFCASGREGLRRHLGAEEILGQVRAAQAHLEPGERLQRIVFMGMGEPLHNSLAVHRALQLLTDPSSWGWSPRRIVVSTSGLVPQIDALGEAFGGGIGLAVSLHAADDALRSRLVPINRRYPLDELHACLRRYPQAPRQRHMIEYTLLGGINDSPAQAKALVAWLRGLRAKVNLIPMNPVPGSGYTAPDETTAEIFADIVRQAGWVCTLRKQRGARATAACGQLAAQGTAQRIKILGA